MAAHDRQATRDRRLQQSSKALVLEAFETLFNRRDFGTAERCFSPTYIQHTGAGGVERLFDLVRTLPATFQYEPRLNVAEGDFVMLHGRYSGYGLPDDSWIAVDILRVEAGILAVHWDVFQVEATLQTTKSGLPMFGDGFPNLAAPA